MKLYRCKDIAKACGVTPRYIWRRAERENWCFTLKRNQNGRPKRLYFFSALPPDIKQKIIEHEVDLSEVPRLEVHDQAPCPILPKHLNNPKIARKFKVAQFLRSLPRGAGRESAAQMLADMYGVHRATIWRWVQWVENRNVKTQEDDFVLPKSKAFSPQALAYGLAVYARNIRCGRKAAYRALQQKAYRSNWKIGDYSSFTRLLKKIPADIWTRIEKGELGFELECVPKIIRNWLAVPVQSIICGDQKIFDYEIYDPETDSIIIPNGYLWMDCASRFINGAWIELGHYNSFTVGYSLREALRYGVPEEIFTDWGKPEGSNHISHIRKSIQELCYTGDYSDFTDKYYLSHKKAQPMKPWQKPIENIMNQIDLILKEHFPPGYRKRQADAWTNKEVQKKLKSERKKNELMTVHEFIELVFKVIDEHNQRKKRLREGTTIVPAKIYKEGLQSQTRLRLPDTTLDYICLPTFQRVPRQGKVGVQVRKGDFREYFSFKLSGYEYVQVSVDPYDPEAPAVLTDPEGNFIDLAEPVPRAVPGESNTVSERFFKARAEYMKEIRTKAQALKDAFGLVDRKEVLAIGKTAHTARKARKEKDFREEAREHQKKQAKVVKMEARRERKRLAQALEEPVQETDGGFQIPEDSRARYRLWKDLDARHDELNAEEYAFWKHFQSTADFHAYKTLEEDFGDAFLGCVK